MFNKILVAIDHSTMSRKVFEAGLFWAKITGGSLMLLHVLSSAEEDYPTRLIDSEPVDNLMSKSLLEIYEEHWQKFEEQGREFLRSLSREATSVGVNTEFTQRWGNPGWNICESAPTWSAELILVGSRGLTGLQEMFLGSVSNYVTHHAPCSVLIVRADADEV